MKFYIVDCFAQEKYQGNPLAVFFPERPISNIEMQKIAKEIGFSECSFVLSGKQADGSYNVSIFTPDGEVPFAGHPVLGTAYILREIIERHSSDTIILNLKAGKIPVVAQGSILVMEQNQPEFDASIDKNAVAKALSLENYDIRDDYPVQWVSTGLPAVIVPLKSVSALHKCHTHYNARQEFIDNFYKCNLLTFAQDGARLCVRVFMDDTGFLEDPATGSANGCLAAYLLHNDYFHSNTIRYEASQGSEMGRPSLLYVEASLVDKIYTIHIGGHVFFIASGIWQ